MVCLYGNMVCLYGNDDKYDECGNNNSVTLETVLANITSSGFIPVQISQTSNWPQFAISMLVVILTSCMLFIPMLFSGSSNPIGSSMAQKKFSKLTGRPTVIINHRQKLFGGSMIDDMTVNQVTKAMSELDGRDFNLVLHSPGGSVFHSILLSKAIKSYSGKVHSYIPKYSMSGGTILALSTDKMHLNRFSCLGMTDPQIGGFLSQGSAAGWKEITDKKGVKASDNAILFGKTGMQVTDSIKNHIKALIRHKTNNNEQIADFLTNGNKEHIYQLGYSRLKSMGFNNLERIRSEEDKLLMKMVG